MNSAFISATTMSGDPCIIATAYIVLVTPCEESPDTTHVHLTIGAMLHLRGSVSEFQAKLILVLQ